MVGVSIQVGLNKRFGVVKVQNGAVVDRVDPVLDSLFVFVEMEGHYVLLRVLACLDEGQERIEVFFFGSRGQPCEISLQPHSLIGILSQIGYCEQNGHRVLLPSFVPIPLYLLIEGVDLARGGFVVG